MDASNTDFCVWIDGKCRFPSQRISELEAELEKLATENMALTNELDDQTKAASSWKREAERLGYGKEGE